MVGFAAEAEPALRGADQPRWIRRLGVELDNARAALEWAVQQGRAADAVAMAAGLAYGWYITGTVQEGQAFIVRALTQEGESSAEHRAVAAAWGAWLIQIGSGATADAVEYAERAVVVGRRGSARGFCTAAVVASLLRAYRGLTVEASELIEEAAAMLVEAPDRWLQAFVDWVRSGLVLKMGDADRAAELLRDSVAGFSEVGDRYGRAIASIRLGELAELRGDYDEAIALTTFAYEGTMSSGPGANASILATRLGNLAALQGRFVDAGDVARDRSVTGPGVGLSRSGGAGVERHGGGRRSAGPPRGGRDPPPRGAGRLRSGSDRWRAPRSRTPVSASWLRIEATRRRRWSCTAGVCARRRGAASGGPWPSPWKDWPPPTSSPGTGRRPLGCSAWPPSYAAPIVVAPWLVAERARTEASARSILGDAAYERAHGSGRRQADAVVAGLVAECDPDRR